MKTYSSEVNQLAQTAINAQRTGDTAGAAKIWSSVLTRAPDHPEALFALGRQAMDARDLPRALDLFRQAAASNPKQPVIHLNIAYVAEAMGDVNTQGVALENAVKIDPYFYPAQFARGVLFEQIGKPKQAVGIYKNALKIAPPLESLPPSLAAQATRAKNAIAEHAAKKRTYLLSKLQSARAAHASDDLERFDEALDIAAGSKKPFVHEPVDFHYPALPSVCFFKRDLFPWLEKLEAHTETIATELDAVLAEVGSEFDAYVQKHETAPINQWAELNNSKRWSALFLWRDGKRVDHIQAKAPKTAALLAELPLLDLPGHGPSAFFSALDQHTRIPPHTGVNNFRSIVHLPLIVPDNAWFRVGNHTRPFKRGEAWVFDDSIEHEAANDSADRRIILIFDIWNPFLTAAERDLMRGLIAAEDEFEKD